MAKTAICQLDSRTGFASTLEKYYNIYLVVRLTERAVLSRHWAIRHSVTTDVRMSKRSLSSNAIY